MGDSEVGAKHMQDKSGSTCHVRKQEVHKRKKKWKGGCQKDIGANIKEFPMNKARIILATK